MERGKKQAAVDCGDLWIVAFKNRCVEPPSLKTLALRKTMASRFWETRDVGGDRGHATFGGETERVHVQDFRPRDHALAGAVVRAFES
ncbi:MAG: hypothetical protein C0478_02415 [Planctomyces sp.]|jgi:hypothetical protein|nr:hypothetical protein [Planctomyces sp.]